MPHPLASLASLLRELPLEHPLDAHRKEQQEVRGMWLEAGALLGFAMLFFGVGV